MQHRSDEQSDERSEVQRKSCFAAWSPRSSSLIPKEELFCSIVTSVRWSPNAHSHSRSPQVMHILGGTDPAYGNVSPIVVAIRSHNSHFISHPLTQDYVGQIWKGDDPLQSHFLTDAAKGERSISWDFVQHPKKVRRSRRYVRVNSCLTPAFCRRSSSVARGGTFSSTFTRTWSSSPFTCK